MHPSARAAVLKPCPSLMSNDPGIWFLAGQLLDMAVQIWCMTKESVLLSRVR